MKNTGWLATPESIVEEAGKIMKKMDKDVLAWNARAHGMSREDELRLSLPDLLFISAEEIGCEDEIREMFNSLLDGDAIKGYKKII